MLSQKQLDNIGLIVFKKKLNNDQTEALYSMAEFFEDYGGKLNAQLAYIFATAYHEVGPALKPVREGFAKDDAQAIRITTKMFTDGKISTNYALPVNGKSYFGRGFVQLTWEANYKKLGKVLGEPLAEKPELALETEIAAKIIVKGMIDGLFSNKKLSDYINDKKTDYTGARRIINGIDRAAMVSAYAIKFAQALDAK